MSSSARRRPRCVITLIACALLLIQVYAILARPQELIDIHTLPDFNVTVGKVAASIFQDDSGSSSISNNGEIVMDDSDAPMMASASTHQGASSASGSSAVSIVNRNDSLLSSVQGPEKTRILTHHPNPARAPLTEDLRGSQQDIIFPDSFEVLFDPIQRLDGVPSCAQGGLFCEDIPTYPQQQVTDVLRRFHGHNELFIDDEITSEIANRIGEQQELKFCKSRIRTIYPKAGKTKDNKWKYIINQNKQGQMQGVKVEVCDSAERPCDLPGSLPNGYSTRCKQEFVNRLMLSLSDEGDVQPDVFMMPSTCCCSYRRDNPFFTSRSSAALSGSTP